VISPLQAASLIFDEPAGVSAPLVTQAQPARQSSSLLVKWLPMPQRCTAGTACLAPVNA
jgi:hypothetical protein